MSTTLTTALSRVRDHLNEATAREWSDAQLTQFINEGVRDVARRAEVLQTKADVSVTAGTQEYTIPTDALRVTRCEYTPTGSSSIYPLEYRDFNAADQIWWTSRATSRGTPVLYTLFGYPPSIKTTLYPTPSQDGKLSVYYYKLPALISTGSETLGVPEGWEDLVVYYAEYMALRRDADPRWQEAFQLYEAKLQDMMILTRRWTDQAGVVVSDTGLAVPQWLWDDGW